MQAVLPPVGPRGFLRVTQLTLGLVVANIVSGAAVRLSDSGLGCPDWPTCSRHHITPPLSLHPAIEFSNRLVVVALCVAAAATVVAALRRRPRRRDLTWLAAGLVGGILLEVVVGAVVVYSKLNPYVVMVHFLVGIALLTVSVLLALRAGRAGTTGPSMVTAGVRRLTGLCLGVLVLAIAAGTATTGAGPHAGGPGAKRIPVPLVDMARTHAEIVLVLGALTLGLLYLLDRTSAPAAVVDRGRLLLVAMVAQGVVGYTQYFSHLPPLLVAVHVFGVALLWTTALWFADGLFHHRPEAAVTPGADRSRPRSTVVLAGPVTDTADTPPRPTVTDAGTGVGVGVGRWQR